MKKIKSAKPSPSALASVRDTAKRLQECHEMTAQYERALQCQVREIIMAHEDGLRDWARSMKISAGYACDLAHGRRKVSNAMINKILTEDGLDKQNST